MAALLLLLTFAPSASYWCQGGSKAVLRQLGKVFVNPVLEHQWRVAERRKQSLQKYIVPVGRAGSCSLVSGP